jgi:hypothetical protein
MSNTIGAWLEAQRINGGSHGFECIGIARMQQVWDAAREEFKQQLSTKDAEIERLNLFVNQAGHLTIALEQLAEMEEKYLVERGMRRLNSGELEALKQQLADKDALLRQARDTLEITHELYVNASRGYGYARPENPYNFHCDIDCCSKEEIEAHSKACDDYAAGRKISDDSWGIGTYCDEYTPALEALAAINKELAR